MSKNKDNKNKKGIKHKIKGKVVGLITGAAVASMIPTIITGSIGLALFGAIGYYVTNFKDKEEEDEDDSARVASASQLKCNCTLVYDGKQFVNGYDSSILNGTGISIIGSSSGTGMSNSKGESTAIGEKIAETARNQPEIPYVWGGSHSLGCENTWKRGADCSSETFYNLKEAGIELNVSGVPTSSSFRGLGTEVASWDEMLPGDIVCTPGHVCTYIGNNEIWSSGGRGGHSSIISADYYKSKYVTIRRFATDVTVNSSSDNSSGSDGGNNSSRSTNTGIGKGIIDNDRASTNTGIGSGIIDGNSNKSTNTGIGSTGGLSSSSSSETRLGKYIDNQYYLPIYDGYTFDENKYNHWDIDYSRFWNGNIPSSDPMYGAGDFVDHYDNNIVVSEFKKSVLDSGGYTSTKDGKFHKISSAFNKFRADDLKGNTATRDGRLVTASPMVLFGPESAEKTEWYENTLLTAPANSRTGNSKDSPTVGVPNQFIKYSGTDGMYFDVVLDNGEVIACMTGDAMALHTGVNPGRGSKSYDRVSKGAYHLTTSYNESAGKDTSGMRWNFFEIVGAPDKHINELKSFLKGKRIASVRVYDIALKNGEYFKNGGTDSSFGLVGGQADSSWVSNGVYSGSTGVKGKLKFNSDGTICINCTCKGDCECHKANMSGGKGSGAISKSLESTPGVPQGIYYNWAEQRQYTSDEIYSMFKTQFPNLFNQLQPTFGYWTYYEGNEVPITYDGDKWTELFGEVGIIPYDQGEAYWKNQYWHINVSSGRYLDSVDNRGTAYMGKNSCGLFARAIVASTMLHRIITPTECLMAIALSPTLSNTGYKGSYWDGNPYRYSASNHIYDSFVYKGKNLLQAENAPSLDMSKVDDTLAKGGMIILVTHNVNGGWTSSGHYMTITGKDSDGLYRFADSSAKITRKSPTDHRSMLKGHTISELHGGSGINQITYVTPGPGYSAYIKDVFGKDV